MKRILFRSFAGLLLLVFGLVGYVAYSFHSLSTQSFTARDFSIGAEVEAADVELGRRIYAVRSGCIECHGADGAGSLVMDNPAMGSIRGANITPFNLQDWTDEEIARAIRYGIHKDGRSLRFMPAFDYAGLSKSDIAALVAYLRSVPAVETPPLANRFGPIARALSVAGKMPVMFPAAHIDLSQDFAVKPPEGPTAEFGHYLAGACIGCHRDDMSGGPIPGGDPSWPPASNARLGADPSWTRERFAEMIASGISPLSGQPVRAPMPVELLRQFNDDEVAALWEYLSTLK